MSNIVDAIINLVNHPNVNLVENDNGNNRANNAGDALEYFIKDMFAGTFGWEEEQTTLRWGEVFSYLGNSHNLPDAMLRGGDMIEVKKIEQKTSGLSLNSSHPKHTVLSSNLMLSKQCREAEDWTEKDIIYAVGVVEKEQFNLSRLCLVYGLDYCASEECYSRIKDRVKEGVHEVLGDDFADTEELGRVNRVDPLGVTYLRVRGMWGIDNPWKVFSYVYTAPDEVTFDFMCIINNQKWETFENRSDLIELNEQCERLHIQNVQIKNPDNPADLRNAKLITFCF